jgi:alpha-glucosidase
MLRYYGHDDELQLAFNFPFLFSDFGARQLAGAAGETFAGLPARACPVWTGSNHDVSRLTSRWAAGDERRARLAMLILLTLPGTVTLYYGDEIGMTDVDVPPAEQRDTMTRNQPLRRPSRDRARTPMQWSAGVGAGFCAPGVKPWLPFGDHERVNVAAQRDRPGSMLTLVRDLVRLRRAELSGGVARYEELAVTDACWAYRAGDLVVAANLSDGPATVAVPAGDVLLATREPPAAATGGPLTLGAWQGVVIRAPLAR